MVSFISICNRVTFQQTKYSVFQQMFHDFPNKDKTIHKHIYPLFVQIYQNCDQLAFDIIQYYVTLIIDNAFKTLLQCYMASYKVQPSLIP